MPAQIDFGYPWWLTYGHVPVVAAALFFCLVGYFFKWSRVPMLLVGLVTIWSLAAFAADRFYMNVNGRLPLPTLQFLPSGTGRVLDMGAGTGRSTLMVLEARPQTKVVALDLFSESYREHFGTTVSGQEKLLANLRAAGVDQRATIETADMRSLPFETASFDGIVSTYAIDHLNRAGVDRALSEAARVLKPGGDFLMMVITKDVWLRFTFGPLLMHSGFRSQASWRSLLEKAGLPVVEQGSVPATFYFLARKPA